MGSFLATGRLAPSILGLLVIACSSEDAPTPTLTDSPSGGQTAHDGTAAPGFRLVNAWFDSSAIGVFADGEALRDPVVSGTVSRQSVITPDAQLTIIIGQTSTEVRPPSGDWASGVNYLAVALTSADGAVKVPVLIEAGSPPDGLRRFRVLNGSWQESDVLIASVGESDQDFAPAQLANGLAPGSLAGPIDVAASSRFVRLHVGGRQLHCELDSDVSDRATLIVAPHGRKPALVVVDEHEANVPECVEIDPKAQLRGVNAAQPLLVMTVAGSPLATLPFATASGYAIVPAAELLTLAAEDQTGASGPPAELEHLFEAASRNTVFVVRPNGKDALIAFDDDAAELQLINGAGIAEVSVGGSPVQPLGSSPLTPGPLSVALGSKTYTCQVPTGGVRYAVLLDSGEAPSLLLDTLGQAPVLSPCVADVVPTGEVSILVTASDATLDVYQELADHGGDTGLNLIVASLPALTATAPFALPTDAATLRFVPTGLEPASFALRMPQIELPAGALRRVLIRGLGNKLVGSVYERPAPAAEHMVVTTIDGSPTGDSTGRLFALVDAGANAAPYWTPLGPLGGAAASIPGYAIEGFGFANDPVAAEPTHECGPGKLAVGQSAMAILVDLDDGPAVVLWADVALVLPCTEILPPPTSPVRAISLARLSTPVTITTGLSTRTLDFAGGSEYTVELSDLFEAAAAAAPLSATYGPNNLIPNQPYTFAAVGNSSGMGILAIPDSANTDPTFASVRAIHVAAGAGALDLAAVSPDGQLVDLATDLTFGAAAPTSFVTAGSLTVALADSAGSQLRCTVPGLEAGSAINLYVATDPSGARVLVVQPTSSGSPTIVPCTTPIDGIARILNATTGSATITVDGVSSGSIASPSVPLTLGLLAGSHTITLSPTLGGAAASAAVTITTGSHTTVIGVAAPLAVLALPHATASVGTVRYRIASALAGPSVGVTLRPDGAPPTGLGTLAVAQASPAFTAPSGPSALELDLDDDGYPDLACALPSFSGASVHIVLVRSGADIRAWLDPTTAEPLFVECLAPPPPPALVTVVHLLPTAAEIDVLGGAVPLSLGLPYTKASAPLSVDIELALTALGPSGAPLASVGAGTLLAGGTHSVVFYGKTPGSIVLVEASTLPAAGDIRYRLTNATSGIAIGVLGLGGIPVPVANDLPPGQATWYISAKAGVLQLGIDLDDNGVADRACSTSLSADQNYNVHVFGDATAVALVVQNAGTTTLVPCDDVD